MASDAALVCDRLALLCRRLERRQHLERVEDVVRVEHRLDAYSLRQRSRDALQPHCGAKPRLGAPRITPIMPSLLDMCRKGGFITPTPCSAEMEPRRSAIHSKTYGSMAACDQLPLVTHRL